MPKVAKAPTPLFVLHVDSDESNRRLLRESLGASFDRPCSVTSCSSIPEGQRTFARCNFDLVICNATVGSAPTDVGNGTKWVGQLQARGRHAAVWPEGSQNATRIPKAMDDVRNIARQSLSHLS